MNQWTNNARAGNEPQPPDQDLCGNVGDALSNPSLLVN